MQRRDRAALALVLLAGAKPAAYAAQVETEWAKQVGRAIKHVLLVIKNNPEKNAAEILARPDVQEALTKPVLQAGQFTMSRIFAAWDNENGPTPSNYLDSIVADVMRNTVTAPARLQQVVSMDLKQTESAMRKVAVDLARRSGLGVRVAEVRASAERDLVSLVEAGHAHKRWVAHLDENTCSHCASLHNMVIPALDSFPADAGERYLRVYQDLLGPPRHPRCRCRLVPA